ncbi:MAG: hypothetical protein WB439_12025 [Acidobacteriaceae bacterium]
MRITLQLAALLLFTATTVRAQITNPDNLIAPPPRNPAIHRPLPADNLQWLWQYTQPAPNGNEAGLLDDPRFKSMLHDNLKAPQSFFRNGALPLADVAEHYFGMIFSAVRGMDNRYITFNSCVPHDCTSQGLLWIDTAPAHPTIVFVATQWTTEGKSDADPDADFNLWVFSNRPLDPEHPPPTLVTAISKWDYMQPRHIKTALIVDPNGMPHKVDPRILGATPSTSTK